MSIFKSCYHCKERYPGCHSTCSKYLKEKEEWEAIKAKMEKDRAPVLTSYDFDKIAYSSCKRHKRNPR